MSFIAKLFIEEEERLLLNTSVLFHQIVDWNGKAGHLTRGGLIDLEVQSTEDDDLFYDWLITDKTSKEGLIRFYKRDGLSTLFELEFANCYCVNLLTFFSNSGNEPMMLKMTLSPGIQRFKDCIHEKPWNPDNPFKGKTDPPKPKPPIEEDKDPVISEVIWQNDKEEELKEATYGVEVNLFVKIKNPKGGAADSGPTRSTPNVRAVSIILA